MIKIEGMPTGKLNILRGSSKKIIGSARIKSEIGFLDITKDESVFVVGWFEDARIRRNNDAFFPIPQNL